MTPRPRRIVITNIVPHRLGGSIHWSGILDLLSSPLSSLTPQYRRAHFLDRPRQSTTSNSFGAVLAQASVTSVLKSYSLSNSLGWTTPLESHPIPRGRTVYNNRHLLPFNPHLQPQHHLLILQPNQKCLAKMSPSKPPTKSPSAAGSTPPLPHPPNSPAW